MLVCAHALVKRGDLPVPEWLFGWAAAAVLIGSFAAQIALGHQAQFVVDHREEFIECIALSVRGTDKEPSDLIL
jgi:hypothetical protein